VSRVKVFISSPRDVAEERELARSVIEQINRLDHVRTRFALQSFSYEHDAPPLAGQSAQRVVDEHMLEANRTDIFVCILWARMGTPLVCSRTGQSFQSGTEYEFTRAYHANQANGRPYMLLYRCDRPLPPDADAKQVSLVEDFFREFERPGGRFVGLINGLPKTVQEFGEMLRVHLLNLLERMEVPRSAAIVGVPPSDTSFVNRHQELDKVCRLLVDRSAGLVTLRGTGGIGKTRLACEVAHAVAKDFPGGCVYAELKERDSAERVAYAVAYALGRAAQLNRDEAPVRLVGELLAALPATLLLLNNLEPLPGLAAATLGPWRQVAPRVRLLVTTRAALAAGIDDEHSLRLGGLPVPPSSDRGPGWLDRLAANESVCLFVQAAGRHRDFTLTEDNAADVERLCRMLEGQPLALILVARLATDATPAELADDLEHRLHRVGDAMRQSIALSFERLLAHEQKVLCQVCIFRDGFTLDGANQVVRLKLPPRVVLRDVIRRLCDVSLLESMPQGRETRYWMYQTIRGFCCEQWATPLKPPAALARRCADYFARFVESQATRITTAEGLEAVNYIVREHDNLLAAHEYALGAGAALLAARLVLGCARALAIRAPWQLRRNLLTRTLEVLPADARHERARLLIELADTYWGVGDYETGHDHACQAVDLARSSDDDGLLAAALRKRGSTGNDVGRRTEALNDFQASLRLAQKRGDEDLAACNLIGLANVHDRQGRRDPAYQAAQQAVDLLRRRGNAIDLALAVNVRGLVQWHFGDPAAALESFREAEDLERRLGNERVAAGRRTNQAFALTDLDRLSEALELFAEVHRVYVELANVAWRAVNAAGWGQALFLAGRTAEAVDKLAQALPEARTSGYAENEALAAGNLGRALLTLGRPDEAARHLQRAVVIQRKIDLGHNRRYWGNLITLARAQRQRQRPAAARILVQLAMRLGNELKVRPDDAVRLVRDDHAALAELTAWLEGGS
jgi:predicted ATPase